MKRTANRKAVVIGLGYFSQFHLSAWQARPDVDLCGITDIDPARTARVAAERGVQGFGGADELIKATDPDIVDLVVPPQAQAALLKVCLKQGRTIICQKPFGRSLAEAEEMTAMAEAADTTLVIHENFRFQPWHRQIKRFLDAGGMGQVFQARFALRPGDGRGARAYLDRQPAFQGMEQFLIRETGVHFIDLFRWLFGDIQSVYADLRRLNPAIRGEDAGLLLMTHAGGAASVFDGNRLSDHVAENPRLTMGEMMIEGEGGNLTLDGFGRLKFRGFGSDRMESIAMADPVDGASFGGGCVAGLIGHVIEALDGSGGLENTAREYLDVIRVSEAAYRSQKEGRRVLI